MLHLSFPSTRRAVSFVEKCLLLHRSGSTNGIYVKMRPACRAQSDSVISMLLLLPYCFRVNSSSRRCVPWTATRRATAGICSRQNRRSHNIQFQPLLYFPVDGLLRMARRYMACYRAVVYICTRFRSSRARFTPAHTSTP